jgi:hypothetical protein
VDAELRHEALHVSPDRIDGEMQPLGHLLAVGALSHLQQYIPFAAGEGRERVFLAHLVQLV